MAGMRETAEAKAEARKERNRRYYERGREKARAAAMEWQDRQAERDFSYSELAELSDYFTKLGWRFGLIHEFRENGIL